MAHGDLTDLVFFMLLAIAIQLFAFPDTLFADLGPLKAQFNTKTADMDLIIKVGAGLFLMLACAFSGVSWNKINGKGPGVGGFLTAGFLVYTTISADSNVFVPRIFYVYAAVLFLGSLKICLFPSNALPEKTEKTKNNHGNTSDMVALHLIIASLICLFYPDYMFQDVGPVKAQFSAKTTDLVRMIRFGGFLMLTLATIFSGVKWNPINGKMLGVGAFLAAGYTCYSMFKADSDVVVPHILHIYATTIFVGAVHIGIFPANPPVTQVSAKKD